MDPYLAEIRPFAGTYAPVGWLFCDGSIISIADYQPLYALLGAQFGGNGTTTFALPDLRGRLPIGSGQGPGLTNHPYASHGGNESVTLLAAQTPLHNHAFNVSNGGASANLPANNLFANAAPGVFYASVQIQGSPLQVLNADTVSSAGGGLPHENRMPSMAINYIIAVNGLYPSFQ